MEDLSKECVALKATFLLLLLVLQNPHCCSKTSEHVFALEHGLSLWHDGCFDELLKEGETIQRKFAVGPRTISTDLAGSFSKLMFRGKVKAALRLLNGSGSMSGQPLPLDTPVSSGGSIVTVRDKLMEKHPDPPDHKPHFIEFHQINGGLIRCDPTDGWGCWSFREGCLSLEDEPDLVSVDSTELETNDYDLPCDTSTSNDTESDSQSQSHTHSTCTDDDNGGFALTVTPSSTSSLFTSSSLQAVSMASCCSSTSSSLPSNIANKKFFSVNPDKRFTLTGFSDWKHGKGKSGILTKHDSSIKHKKAVLAWKDYQLTQQNSQASIANKLVTGRRKEVEENRQYVTILIETLLYCIQQGIALRGHCEVDTEDMDINLELLKKHITSGPRNTSLLGHHYQNNILSILAESVLNCIKEDHRAAKYFTLIVDETKDISKKEQLTLILRYVLKGVVHECFISYTHYEELNAAALTTYIYQALKTINLSISNCVSQCYNGAAVMSGPFTGVCSRILEDNPQSIYIHCYAHQLNLTLVDCCHSLPHASNFFALLESLYVFMSSSVPHSLLLNKQKEMKIKELRLVKLSDTRWSCRHTSMKAVKTIFAAILSTLDEIFDTTGTRAIEARGLLHQVQSFSFLLSLIIFDKIFSITGNLSNLLQAEQINYSAAAICITATKTTLVNLRSEAKWKKLWDEAVKLANSLNIHITVTSAHRQRQPPSSLSGFSIDREQHSRYF
ncbi:PREDICTED: zinc finger MYM-type protein 1-like [Amphimedon queenslandica]|uniref:DUF4371 domain-containing protein n=1 Tax=Amphimedon queenslandica TaxID=400682 RepID=A0AAN0IQM2_AMPQE|nr:PREDICTED: zinc finger MYM-type protein 1-like [Amphimedon queenslandica]|eukprot:XP_011407653.1 PREDICTED: zinc finger MYM-type protein 1-like [Amphimedon queenslandica]